MAAVLITGIWAVEYRGHSTNVVPAPVKATSKATAQAPVKAKVKKHKRVSRSRAHGFTAPQTGSNRRLGKELAADHGWTGEQWDCLNNLWQKESGWSATSDNPTSSAYGIPQILGLEKRTGPDPAKQILAGISYIDNRYGTACKAWGHWQSHNWY